MTKEEFRQIDNENEYISNMLKAHKKDIGRRLDIFIDPLYKKINKYGFIYCIHTHYYPVKIHVYDGTNDDSNSIDIQDFKIIAKTDSFPGDALKIVEEWLSEFE